MSTQLIIYATAAEIIKDFLLSKNSLKNLCYAPSVRNKKQVYALVLQTLKYRPVLVFLLSLAQVPGFEYHELIRRAAILEGERHISADNTHQLERPKKHESEIERYENEFFRIKQSRMEWHTQQQRKSSQSTMNQADGETDSDDPLPPADGNSDGDGDSSVGEEDASGISNKWYPSYVVYCHGKTVGQQRKGQAKPSQKRKFSSLESQPMSALSDSVYQYPIEAMLVVCYDALFGSGLPKLSALLPDGVTPQGKQITQVFQDYPLFQRGVVDAVRLFHIPNPPNVMLQHELEDRAKHVRGKARLGISSAPSRTEAPKRGSESTPVPPPWAQSQSSGSSSFHQPIITADSLFSSARKQSTSPAASAPTTTSKPKMSKLGMRDLILSTSWQPSLDISFPINSSTAIERPWTSLITFQPDFTYRQRLTMSLSQVEDSYRQQYPASAPSSKSSLTASGGAGGKRKNYEFLLPETLQDKYQRVIPRYARINTNNTTHRDILQQLDELGYQQLMAIPRSFRLPLPSVDGFPDAISSAKHDIIHPTPPPTHQEGSKPLPPIGDSPSGDDDDDEDDESSDEVHPRGALSCYQDYYDPKFQGHFDWEHRLNRMFAPSMKIGSDLWHLFGFEDDLPDDFDLLAYKTKSVIGRPPNLHSTIGIHHHRDPKNEYAKYTVRNFWVDPVVPDLLCFSPTDTFILTTPLVKAGQLIIQDRASCFPPLALRPPPGAVAIDGCSAPGNKTSYLSSIMQNKGKVYAIEINSRRASLMGDRLEASNCSNVEIINTSFFDIDPTDPRFAPTEYIMLDPSCSGSGGESMDVLLANDGMSHAEDSRHVQSLAALQLSLIKHALTFPNLKALAYSTCSIFQAENECVVESILPLTQEKGLELIPVLPLFSGRGVATPTSAQKGIPMEYTVRADPVAHHSGGFFLALFARPGVYNNAALGQLLACTLHRYGINPTFRFPF